MGSVRLSPLLLEPELTSALPFRRPVVALWPGSCLHAVKTFKHPRWEDYEYVSANTEHENRLGWLGNGWTEEDAGGDTAFYLKDVDYPPVPAQVSN
jgi:hypothetical protein